MTENQTDWYDPEHLDAVASLTDEQWAVLAR